MRDNGSGIGLNSLQRRELRTISTETISLIVFIADSPTHTHNPLLLTVLLVVVGVLPHPYSHIVVEYVGVDVCFEEDVVRDLFPCHWFVLEIDSRQGSVLYR